MPEYSEQDLKYAAELREDIHREALAIVRRTWPAAAKIIDPHPVEDYFQENWEYPGKWYTVVAIPCGYKSRKAFVDSLVKNTLASKAAEPEQPDARGSNNMPNAAPNTDPDDMYNELPHRNRKQYRTQMV